MPELNLGKVVGPQGPQGETGPAGAQGIQGPQGATGEAGKSAYQAAREGGYTGTEAEFNAVMAIIDKHAGRHRTGGADPLTAPDVGAAPAGFGLGTTIARYIPQTDSLDDYKASGWYYWQNPPTNAPTDNANMVVHGFNSNYIVQRVYNVASSDRCTCMERSCYYGVWRPWEYHNPNMSLGVEYRTTERFQGKPVYALFAEFGVNRNGRTVYFGENIQSVVRGVAYAGDTSPYPLYQGTAFGDWSCWYQFERGIDPTDNIRKVKVTCFAGASMSENYKGDKVLLHYTKSE